MSAVDVLAVMERVAKNLHVLSGVKFNAPSSEAFSLEEARAAVAELIEAASDVTAEITRDPEPDTPMARLDAALARVQGDAA